MRPVPAFILAAIVGGVVYYSDVVHLPAAEPARPPACLVPVQRDLPAPQTFARGDYQLTKVARYEVTARVLGRERYFLDRWSSLSPIDLALGWGLMSSKRVVDKISISQGGRFYRWYTSEFPIPEEEIVSNSANTHIIPATKEVEKTVKSLRKGAYAHFDGYLVNVTGPKGSWWNTSLSRGDSGDGACELFYVEMVQIIK